MNRKKEKSALRKEGNLYVIDLFDPWKLTHTIKLRMEESKGNELRSTANQLFDGRRCERGRQVQAN